MRIKKFIVLIFIIASLVFSLGVIILNSDLGNNIIDTMHWSEEKRILKEIDISRIIFYSGKDMALIEGEQFQVLQK